MWDEKGRNLQPNARPFGVPNGRGLPHQTWQQGLCDRQADRQKDRLSGTFDGLEGVQVLAPVPRALDS